LRGGAEFEEQKRRTFTRFEKGSGGERGELGLALGAGGEIIVKLAEL